MSDQGPDHPLLDEDEQQQRGENPPGAIGHIPDHPADPDPDPAFVPDPGRADEWRRLAEEIGRGHRPRRENVYPRLLVRAFSPGDRGKRPVWPPTVCCESPDVLLIDASYSGAFDPARLVVSSAAGRAYRVFVRVWNLGLFPAVGVHVQAWAVAAGFFGAGNADDPYYQQHHIGGAWADLTDRRQPGCMEIVELDRHWLIGPKETGHICLIASVSCPADHFTGPLVVNEHRHVGQRNLTVFDPAANAQQLITTLAGLVPRGFTLELTHGGPAALPLLQALGGGTLPVDGGKRRIPIIAPALDKIRGGVNIGASIHLLTAFEANGLSVVARSDVLATHLGLREADPGSRVHPFAEAGGSRRLLDQLGPEYWGEVAQVSKDPLVEALPHGIMGTLDVVDMQADTLAHAFGGPEHVQHLLRFTLTSPKGQLIGGYSIVVS
jgi:hypothetical protein